jgi:hypothetical protein
LATVLTQYTQPTTQTATPPTTWATRVPTMHGMVTVQSRYDAARRQWTHSVPSYSHPGTYHTIIAGKCDCPARRICWHERAVQAAESSLHLILWEVLTRELCSWSSMESYGYGLATCERMGIPTTGQWGSRDAAITAMEALTQ